MPTREAESGAKMRLWGKLRCPRVGNTAAPYRGESEQCLSPQLGVSRAAASPLLFRAGAATHQPSVPWKYSFFWEVLNKYMQETLLRENFYTFSICCSLGFGFFFFLTKVLVEQRIPSVWLFY